MQLLLSLKPNTEARDKHKSTPLCIAAHKNRPGIAEILVRGGADSDAINERDSDRTHFHMAAEEGDSVAAAILIKVCANKEAEDRDLLRPLHVAASNGKNLCCGAFGD